MIYYLANMYPVIHPMYVSTDLFSDIMYDYYFGFHNALKIYAKIGFLYQIVDFEVAV
jgi:hypothetical protein